jgi:hypothetical protein
MGEGGSSTNVVNNAHQESHPKMENSLASLMAWYEREMKQKLNRTPTIQSLDISYDQQSRHHQLLEDQLDLAPLPLVSRDIHNNRMKDNNVLHSVDGVLDVFDTNPDPGLTMTSAALIGELEPTPLFSDFVPSSSTKRSLDAKGGQIIIDPLAEKQRVPSNENEEGINCFRSYQAEQWTQRYKELCEYCKTHGHCQVPHTHTKSPALARWVKRQRYQYKLRSECKPSTMTDERIAVLERIGFIWDSHVAAWGERRAELIEYRNIYGHCNVPSNYTANRQLAVWVKRQRRQYKFYWEGKPSSMSKERIASLQAVGFEWQLRSRSDSKKKI